MNGKVNLVIKVLECYLLTFVTFKPCENSFRKLFQKTPLKKKILSKHHKRTAPLTIFPNDDPFCPQVRQTTESNVNEPHLSLNSIVKLLILKEKYLRLGFELFGGKKILLPSPE